MHSIFWKYFGQVRWKISIYNVNEASGQQDSELELKYSAQDFWVLPSMLHLLRPREPDIQETSVRNVSKKSGIISLVYVFILVPVLYVDSCFIVYLPFLPKDKFLEGRLLSSVAARFLSLSPIWNLVLIQFTE